MLPPKLHFPALQTVQATVAFHAARTPQALALTCAGTALDYATLHRHSNRTAQALQRAGLPREARVAYLGKETAATRKAYGLDDKHTADFGTRLLLARRLVERGVRFVQVYSGGGPVSVQWDAHDDVNENHEKMCRFVDQPLAALLHDLKGRGLLKDTLVVWCTEFGRTPMSQGGKGRDHCRARAPTPTCPHHSTTSLVCLHRPQRRC